MKKDDEKDVREQHRTLPEYHDGEWESPFADDIENYLKCWFLKICKPDYHG